jgi:hypothetical protein
MVVPPITLAFGRLGQKDGKFQASLHYIVSDTLTHKHKTKLNASGSRLQS